MRETIKTDHATLLNALHDMQRSPVYALRRGALQEAESLIVRQEKRIKELEAQAGASPAQQEQTKRKELYEMHNDAGKVTGWYFSCDGHYIDVEKDEQGKYSVYFRNRIDGKEVWMDQAEAAHPQPAAQPQTKVIMEAASKLAYLAGDIDDDSLNEEILVQVRRIADALPSAALAAQPQQDSADRDAEMLDWLEMMANQPGGILLHDGGDFTGRLGLGLRRVGRSIRDAIRAAMLREEGEKK
jgi:hypothetical protein